MTINDLDNIKYLYTTDNGIDVYDTTSVDEDDLTAFIKSQWGDDAYHVPREEESNIYRDCTNTVSICQIAMDGNNLIGVREYDYDKLDEYMDDTISEEIEKEYGHGLRIYCNTSPADEWVTIGDDNHIKPEDYDKLRQMADDLDVDFDEDYIDDVISECRDALRDIARERRSDMEADLEDWDIADWDVYTWVGCVSSYKRACEIKTKEQLQAAGNLIAAIEDYSTLDSGIVAKLLRNPIDNAFAYHFREAISRAATSGDDVTGKHLADLYATMGEMANINPVEQVTIQNAYLKAKVSNQTDARKAFGEQVKRLRTEKGLSTNDLAALTGLRQQNISRIESGRYSVTLDTISRLIRVLGEITIG